MNSLYTNFFPSPVYVIFQAPPYCSPLGTASENGYTEIAEKLLEGGARVDYHDEVIYVYIYIYIYIYIYYI